MKKAMKKKLAKKRVTPEKLLVQKRAARKKAKVKMKVAGKRRAHLRNRLRREEAKAWIRWHSHQRDWECGQASNRENCRDYPTSKVPISESVDELLEEGDTFEAEVVKGVEDAEDADEEEVRTHEVPQDDVPGEYLGLVTETRLLIVFFISDPQRE